MIVRINNNLWTIKFVNPTSKDLLRSNKTRTLGVCDNSIKTIFIANNLNDYMLNKVLSHELVHVYAFEYNYYMSLETEEIVADFISLFGHDIVYVADDIMSKLISNVA